MSPFAKASTPQFHRLQLSLDEVIYATTQSQCSQNKLKKSYQICLKLSITRENFMESNQEKGLLTRGWSEK